MRKKAVSSLTTKVKRLISGLRSQAPEATERDLQHKIDVCESYWPLSGSYCGMMVFPSFNYDDPDFAAANLAGLLAEGGNVTYADGGEIRVDHSSPEGYADSSFRGSVEDMTLLRRIVLLWWLGFDIRVIEAFVADDWLFCRRVIRMLDLSEIL